MSLPSTSETSASTSSESSESGIVIYVDAPPPLVNPWRVNPNAASVLTRKDPAVTKTRDQEVANIKDSVVAKPRAPVVTKTRDPIVTKTKDPVVTKTRDPVVTKSKDSERDSHGMCHDSSNNGSYRDQSGVEPSARGNSGPGSSSRSSFNAWDMKKTPTSTSETSTSTSTSSESSESGVVIYVDAPPPLVNPWRVNPSAASLLTKKDPVIMTICSSGPVSSSRSSFNPWDMKKNQELRSAPAKMSGTDWPALEPAIEEVTAKVASVTLECKMVQSDSSSTGSADCLEEDLEAPRKSCTCDVIRRDDKCNCGAVRNENKCSHANGSCRPPLESTQSRHTHISGDENNTSASSDDTVEEVFKRNCTDEMQIKRTKKSSKLKWVPLKLPESATPKHQRVKKEKSLKLKTARFERGESPSGSPSRGRGRGGLRGRGGSRGSRSAHQFFFNESTDPSVIPPPNPRNDYTDYPPDFTTIAPVFSEVSEFIMPYAAEYYASSFIPASDSTPPAIAPVVSYVPAGLEDAVLVELLRQQIEYYFSDENLEKDFYLRRKMDSEGYLPIKLIASFQRVQAMTHNYNAVVSAITSSEILEAKEDLSGVRTLNDPTKWPIADTLYLSGSPEFSSPVPSTNVPNESRSIQAL